MRRLPNQLFPLSLLLLLVGCGFSPETPGGGGGGAAASTGISGGGGVSGSVSGSGLTGGDVGITGAAGTSTECGQGTVPIMPLPPDILIVEDRSGSMDDDQTDKSCQNGGCGANSKWALVTAALNQVVTATDTMVNWGLKFFADADVQCGVNAGVAVNVASGNSGAIAAAIAASTKANGGVNNGSYTPTRKAVNAASSYLGMLTDANPRYILLATDGLPNCPDNCGGNSCSMTPNPTETTAVETSITAAQAAGFKTFVVGIATGTDPTADTALNGFAMAGGEAQSGAATQYYSVTDTASLVAALNKIVGIVASCTISLAGAPPGFTNVVISATDMATGKPIAVTDWTYDANKKNIILDPNGASCMALQSGSYTDFKFNYACNGVPICIDKNADGTCASSI